MKKLIAILLIVCMAIPFASAEDIDLSGMSFDELIALKERINLAIWACKEWQEVKVPAGIYEVGKDIPAGKWTVRCAVDKYSFVSFGNQLKKGGAEIDYHGSTYGHAIIVSADYSRYEEDKDLIQFTFTVDVGDFIQIEESAVLFTPYAGTPDLGFK